MDAASFQCVDCGDERPVFNDRLVPIPDGTPSEIVNSMKEVCSARLSHLRHVLQSVATALLTICAIFGVATDARHVHPNLTEIPPLTTENAQSEHVNSTQTTSVPVVMCKMARGRSSGSRVQWNNGLEATESTTDSGHVRAWENTK